MEICLLGRRQDNTIYPAYLFPTNVISHARTDVIMPSCHVIKVSPINCPSDQECCSRMKVLKPINVYSFVKAKTKNTRRGYKFHGDGFTIFEFNLHKCLMFYDWNKLDESIWEILYFTLNSSYVSLRQYVEEG